MFHKFLAFFFICLVTLITPLKAQKVGPAPIHITITGDCVGVGGDSIPITCNILGSTTMHGSASLALNATETTIATCNNSDSACSTGNWLSPASWTLPSL